MLFADKYRRFFSEKNKIFLNFPHLPEIALYETAKICHTGVTFLNKDVFPANFCRFFEHKGV